MRRIEANLSSTDVTMWTPINATAISDVLRWTARKTNRGTPSVRTRRMLATPSATLSVSSTSATIPVPRVRYQYAVAPVVVASVISGWDHEPPETTPPPPDDGAGAGPWAGGASELPPPDGCC